MSSDQLGEGDSGWVLWSDRALRRDSGSGVSSTGPVSRRAATPPSHRSDEPPSARAPENRVHLVRTGPNDRSRRATRMRCPNTAVFRLSPPLVARPLTRLAIRRGQSHPGLPTHPQPACQRLTSHRLRASRDPTTRPLLRSTRRLCLSLRRRRMPSCGAETHLFSGRSLGDQCERHKREPRLECTLTSQPQRFHQERATRSVTGQRSACGRAVHTVPSAIRHVLSWFECVCYHFA